MMTSASRVLTRIAVAVLAGLVCGLVARAGAALSDGRKQRARPETGIGAVDPAEARRGIDREIDVMRGGTNVPPATEASPGPLSDPAREEWLRQKNAVLLELEQRGMSELGPRFTGPIPIRPLGADLSAFLESRARDPEVAAAWQEDPQEAYRRLSLVNRSTDSVLFGGEFQCFAYRTCDVLQVMIGTQTANHDMDTEQLWLSLTNGSRYHGTGVPAPLRQRFDQLVLEWRSKKENYRRTVWSRTWEVAQKKMEQGQYERGVSAVLVKDQVLLLVRDGEDAELDAMLREYEDIERSTRMSVESLLR